MEKEEELPSEDIEFLEEAGTVEELRRREKFLVDEKVSESLDRMKERAFDVMGQSGNAPTVMTEIPSDWAGLSESQKPDSDGQFVDMENVFGRTKLTLGMLTDAERPHEQTWMKVYKGGINAIMAARELIAAGKTVEVKTETVYVDLSQTKKKVKYVICSKDRKHWLTKSGLGAYSADDAMLFDSELKAEETRSQYLRSSSDSVALRVQELVVGDG
jgi:hypothetical protein